MVKLMDQKWLTNLKINGHLNFNNTKTHINSINSNRKLNWKEKDNMVVLVVKPISAIQHFSPM